MLRSLSADWFRISRFWFPWVLLVALVIAVALQVNGKVGRLRELEAELGSPAAPEGEEPSPLELLGRQNDLYEAAVLREGLVYPAFIGYASNLATDLGWFFLILLTAVVGGEDFTRSTLRSTLVQGVGRGEYLVARCAALWLAAGVGVLTITLLAGAVGPTVHAQVNDKPLSLAGLGEALLAAARAWLACLPFIAATLFWAVLAQQAGPAMGVGIGLHAFEFLNRSVAPILALAMASARGGDLPLIFRWQLRVFSVTLGYSADVLLHWGSPFVKAFSASTAEAKALFATSPAELSGGNLLPTTPWRAVALLAGYTLVFLGGAMWILRHRDVTVGP